MGEDGIAIKPPGEFIRQFLRRLVASLGILFHALQDDRFKVRLRFGDAQNLDIDLMKLAQPPQFRYL